MFGLNGNLSPDSYDQFPVMPVCILSKFYVGVAIITKIYSHSKRLQMYAV